MLEQFEISPEDYFNHDNDKVRTKRTILNNEKACLRRCEDLLKKMEASGEAMFNDPDFGP